jgi:hypothetical protein
MRRGHGENADRRLCAQATFKSWVESGLFVFLRSAGVAFQVAFPTHALCPRIFRPASAASPITDQAIIELILQMYFYLRQLERWGNPQRPFQPPEFKFLFQSIFGNPWYCITADKSTPLVRMVDPNARSLRQPNRPQALK